MIATYVERYEKLFSNLKSVIAQSSTRVIREDPDELFVANVNFFTKSYLISLCTYLEAFLQDVAFAYVRALQARIDAAGIPHNAVHWTVLGEVKEKELRFSGFSLGLTKKDLADELSGNPGKTIALFRYLGLDLKGSVQFEAHRDLVGAVVSKRNNIIHHNDAAADVSMADLVVYGDAFLVYIKAIGEVVSKAIAVEVSADSGV